MLLFVYISLVVYAAFTAVCDVFYCWWWSSSSTLVDSWDVSQLFLKVLNVITWLVWVNPICLSVVFNRMSQCLHKCEGSKFLQKRCRSDVDLTLLCRRHFYIILWQFEPLFLINGFLIKKYECMMVDCLHMLFWSESQKSMNSSFLLVQYKSN